MTRVEQQKMIDELKDYARFMKGRDAFDFEMFVKRDKDDEYLDELSQARLESLYKSVQGDEAEVENEESVREVKPG